MEVKKIYEITNKLFEETNDNIIGVSYGNNVVNGLRTGEKVLSFKVKKKKPLSELTSDEIIPQTIEIDGEVFKTDIVEENVKLLSDFCHPEHYQWWSEMGNIPPKNRFETRPLMGGISVSNWTSKQNLPYLSVGTLGFLAIDKDDDTIVGVTNNHVLIDDAFLAIERKNPNVKTNISGDFVTHPNEPFDYGLGNTIGVVKKYVPIISEVYKSKDDVEIKPDNLVDVALTTIDEGMIDEDSWKQKGLELELETSASGFPFATTDEINEVIYPSGGTGTDYYLYSAGRTSGAKGHLSTKLFCDGGGTVYVQGYNKQGVDNTVKFIETIEFVAVPSGSTSSTGNTCYFPLAGGDSGSALIAYINGEYKIIGLCFAGSFISVILNGKSVDVGVRGFACRIDHVADAMNIEAWNGKLPVKYSDRYNIEEHLVDGLSEDKYIDVGEKKYWQAGLK